MRRAAIVLAVVLVAAVWTGMSLAGSYNRLVTLAEQIEGRWAEVENQLQRRYELIPNLLATVERFAAQERAVIQAVADARAALGAARTAEERVAAANALEGALARLLVVVENYPDLKSDATYIRLFDELAGTENRLAVARMRFNEQVREYNTVVRRFPMVFVARMLGFEPRAYLQSPEEAKTAPTIP